MEDDLKVVFIHTRIVVYIYSMNETLNAKLEIFVCLSSVPSYSSFGKYNLLQFKRKINLDAEP